MNFFSEYGGTKPILDDSAQSNLTTLHILENNSLGECTQTDEEELVNTDIIYVFMLSHTKGSPVRAFSNHLPPRATR